MDMRRRNGMTTNRSIELYLLLLQNHKTKKIEILSIALVTGVFSIDVIYVELALCKQFLFLAHGFKFFFFFLLDA